MKTSLFAFLLIWTIGVQVAHGHDTGSHGGTNCLAMTNFDASRKFIHALKFPPPAIPVATNAGVPLYVMEMSQFKWSLHPDLPEVDVWGYGGSYPGPTIEALTNLPIQVLWTNSLPATYPPWLPANTSYHGVENDDVRTSVHLHGGATRSESDGFPLDWYKRGGSHLSTYDNIDFSGDGETLWYHDHAVGVTENNVYAGLAGFYFLRVPAIDKALNLPVGLPYEIPLVLQDRDIQTNCEPASLFFTGVPWHMLGVVNGYAWPYHEVEPRKYRLRLLNGSNFRTLHLGLSSGQQFHVIGTDDGFLAAPVKVPASTNQGVLNPGNPLLRLMPAERIDAIVDFTGMEGRRIRLTNANPNDISGSIPLPDFMEFRVSSKKPTVPDFTMPIVLATNLPDPKAMAQLKVRERFVTLDFCPTTDASSCTNGSENNGPPAFLNLMHFSEPVTELPRLGDIEVWSFINLTDEPHPIHLHLIDFFILDRTPFKSGAAAQYAIDRAQKKLVNLTNYLEGSKSGPPNAFERGPKDVVACPQTAVTRIVVQWQGFSGWYVYHCHILDHEDNDMMRPMFVLPALEDSQMAFEKHPVSGETQLHLGTTAGKTYTIQSSTDLKTWLPGGPVPGTGRTVLLQGLIDGGSPTQFFRASRNP